MARVVVHLPQRARRGEIIEIRTLAGHDMETGFRRTQLGKPIPRDIITQFTCRYNGVEVFRAELHPAVAANPLIVFSTLATESGKQRGAAMSEAAAERAAELGKGRDANRVRREGEEAAKRAERRARTAAIDLGLGLVASWFADVAAVAEGAGEAVQNADRSAELAADANRVDPIAARRAAELAMDARRRLRVNVNEDLALDALFHRAAALLRETDRVV